MKKHEKHSVKKSKHGHGSNLKLPKPSQSVHVSGGGVKGGADHNVDDYDPSPRRSPVGLPGDEREED